MWAVIWMASLIERHRPSIQRQYNGTWWFVFRLHQWNVIIAGECNCILILSSSWFCTCKMESDKGVILFSPREFIAHRQFKWQGNSNRKIHLAYKISQIKISTLNIQMLMQFISIEMPVEFSSLNRRSKARRSNEIACSRQWNGAPSTSLFVFRASTIVRYNAKDYECHRQWWRLLMTLWKVRNVTQGIYMIYMHATHFESAFMEDATRSTEMLLSIILYASYTLLETYFEWFNAMRTVMLLNFHDGWWERRIKWMHKIESKHNKCIYSLHYFHTLF